MDPRTDELGARIISPLDKLYLSIKKLSLNRLKGKEVINETSKNSLLDEENIIDE